MGIEPRAIYDIGANRGQFSTAALQHFPRALVVAFEPLPHHARRLRTLLPTPPHRVYECGVGARTEVRDLNVNSHDHSSSFLPLGASHISAFPSARAVGALRCEVRSLDEVALADDLPRPDLIKIDVQGFELAVLEGGAETVRRSRYVLVETSRRPLYEGEASLDSVVAAMRASEFIVDGFVGTLSDPRNGAPLQFDVLFKNRRSMPPHSEAK
jgi:FkbM family methyltransferase